MSFDFVGFLFKKKRFLKFFSVGAVSAVIDLTLFFVLTELIGLKWFVAFPIVFVLIGFFNYFLNKFFTFKNDSKKIKTQSLVFFVIALLGFGLNMLIMGFLIEFFKFWPVFARFVSMWIILIFNYTMHKRITFGLIK